MYQVLFADARIEKNFVKELQKIPKPDQQAIYDELKSLATDPHPHGSRIRTLVGYALYGYPATHRLRIGRYRVLYDLDEKNKKVIILALRKRDEKTYHSH